MEDWIEVESDKLNIDEVEIKDGVKITVGLSPYDVPERVRIRFDEQHKEFIIEFDYIDERHEKTTTTSEADLRIVEGTSSERLYAIRADQNILDGRKLELKLLIPFVSEAIDRLTQKPLSENKRRHFSAINKVIHSIEDQCAAT